MMQKAYETGEGLLHLVLLFLTQLYEISRMPKALHVTLTAPLLRLDTGMKQHYLPVPAEYAEAYDAAGVRRLILSVPPHQWRRALLGTKEGERLIMMGQPILRELGLRVGQSVTFSLHPDPDPDAIDLGEEFEAVLDQDAAAAKRFFSFTPGKQRSLAYYVTSAKREETRIKRALELAHKIKNRQLFSDLNPEE
ncbi:MAG: hypothetical protein GC205_10220 [Bacteroidetes bacterium]|nr:hypothetical protein [Bacteroidota bacterium]